MKGTHKAKKYAVARARDTSMKALKQREAALAAYPAGKHFRQTLRDASLMFGVCGYAPLSNLAVQLFAVEVLIDLMLEHLDRHRHDRQLRYAFFTMTVDAGFCFDHDPEVDVAKLQLSAGRLLRSLKLQGVGCLDVTILRKKLPGELHRRLIVHVHGIVWTRDPDFKWKPQAERLSQSRHYPNMLGAPSITFVTRKQAADRAKAWGAAQAAKRREPAPKFKDRRYRKLDEYSQTPDSIAFMAQYMLAPVIAMKHRYEGPDGGIIIKTDPKALSHKTVLRLAEFYSCITPRQAVFGVGDEGGAIAREFGKRMDAYERDQRKRSRHVDQRGLEMAWRHLLGKHPKLDFEPSVIRHRSG